MTTQQVKPETLVSPLFNLVNGFSWFQLNESTQSILSGLKNHYWRLILKEEKKHIPNLEQIKIWENETQTLEKLQNDNTNFTNRERMIEIIVTYSPILKGFS